MLLRLPNFFPYTNPAESHGAKQSSDTSMPVSPKKLYFILFHIL
jgi:hypothetical protein